MNDNKKSPGMITRRPVLMHKDGRLWFTHEVERRFYFILTIIMLIVGILYKTGVM